MSIQSKRRQTNREIIEEAVKASADGVELWIQEGCEKAMSQINAAKNDKTS